MHKPAYAYRNKKLESMASESAFRSEFGIRWHETVIPPNGTRPSFVGYIEFNFCGDKWVVLSRNVCHFCTNDARCFGGPALAGLSEPFFRVDACNGACSEKADDVVRAFYERDKLHLARVLEASGMHAYAKEKIMATLR